MDQEATEPVSIDTMFAYIAVDDEGNEGITGFMTPQGWVPMVGADSERADSLRSLAQEIADTQKMDVKLVQFQERVHLETIEPNEEYLLNG